MASWQVGGGIARGGFIAPWVESPWLHLYESIVRQGKLIICKTRFR
jgi:hypothetical protein